MNLRIRSLSMLAIANQFEIGEIGGEEGVDLGSKIKDSMLPNLVL